MAPSIFYVFHLFLSAAITELNWALPDILCLDQRWVWQLPAHTAQGYKLWLKRRTGPKLKQTILKMAFSYLLIMDFKENCFNLSICLLSTTTITSFLIHIPLGIRNHRLSRILLFLEIFREKSYDFCLLSQLIEVPNSPIFSDSE